MAQSDSMKVAEALIGANADARAAQNPSAQIEYWKHGINVTLHFNDMCIRLRVLCLTVLATFFAGAAISMAQYPNGVAPLFGLHVHISAVLYFIAFVFVGSLWFLDQAYYYRMLITSVENSEHVEPRLRPVLSGLVEGEMITEALTSAITRRWSRTIANVFYGAQVGLCCLMLLSAVNYGRERQLALTVVLGPPAAEARAPRPPRTVAPRILTPTQAAPTPVSPPLDLRGRSEG